MGWVVAVAWGVAVLFAVVVLGLCAYQITWRLRRLRGDLARLQVLRDELGVIQTDLDSARQRAVAVRSGG